MKKTVITSLLFALVVVTTAQEQPLAKREVTSEATVSKGSLVRIAGANRKLTIKSWEQSKVKVTMQILPDSAAKSMTNDQLLEEVGISIKSFSNRVDILAVRGSQKLVTGTSLQPVTVQGYPRKKTAVPPGQVSQTSPDYQALLAYSMDVNRVYSSRSGNVRPLRTGLGTEILALEITVPSGSKLDVDNQYGDVIINMNLDDAKLDISNGALDMQDVKNLELTAKYCNANFGSIDKAEIEFQNGTLRAQNINDLDLDSKSSTIEYEKGKYAYIRSQADQIYIDEIEKVDGRKTYGSVRIDQLNGNFDMEGNNVDIKIRKISPNVESIKINNKYGDVRLPVRDLKNYFVDFTGYYSTVFTPFEKTIVKEEEKKANSDTAPDQKRKDELVELALANEYLRTSSTLAGEMAPKRFTGSVGDVNGKHTRFQLTCHSCTVDFK